MAKQSEETAITGTYEGVCFYAMQGKYYARMKSSLTGKRVKRDPKFKKTMELAQIFGMACKIAGELYKQLPEHERGRAVRYALIQRVRRMLADGISKERVIKQITRERRIAAGGAVIRRSFIENNDSISVTEANTGSNCHYHGSSST